MGYGQSPLKCIIITHKEAGEAAASGVEIFLNKIYPSKPYFNLVLTGYVLIEYFTILFLKFAQLSNVTVAPFVLTAYIYLILRYIFILRQSTYRIPYDIFPH